MANVKITELTAYTNPASTDVVPIVDLVNDQTKKVTLANIFQNFPDGTAGAPSIAFDGDSNTGIYRPGADQVAISTGGTGRLFIDSSGKVGVGTNNAKEILHVNGSIFGETPANVLDQDITVTPTESGFLKFFQNFTNAVTKEYNLLVYDSQYFGSSLQTTAAIAVKTKWASAGNGLSSSSLIFKTGSRKSGAGANQRLLDSLIIDSKGTSKFTSTASTEPLIVNIDTSEVARIDSSGRLLVGTSTSVGDGSPLQVVNDTANPIEVFRGQASTAGPVLLLNKSRGSTASPSIVNNNDQTGSNRI